MKRFLAAILAGILAAACVVASTPALRAEAMRMAPALYGIPRLASGIPRRRCPRFKTGFRLRSRHPRRRPSSTDRRHGSPYGGVMH